MLYGLSAEQDMIAQTVRSFVEKEIYPHEELVERTGEVPNEIAQHIKEKTLELGFYACNFPESVGCAGLSHVDFALVERELGRGSMALNHFFGRPQNILMACEGDQIDRYLMPAVRGERMDALAMTEPGAGSDIRGMKCSAQRDGGDWVVNGSKHFISGADHADFFIVFIATGEDQTDKTLMAEATRIGLPLMIKASAGGGGRGMRVVTDTAEIADQLKGARTEAKNAFGSDELIFERAVMRPRHVEIQVFGDQHGNVIHLGERDCSVQRRHQKVVEEAPSPAVDEALRARMGQAAVEAAKSCNYVGAGTVEFLLDASGEFYFLEMNTRLQVEHPVTELVTGLDLVALQIRVARGETLPITQEQVQLKGHAIEVRLYAEDPSQNFLPQTGEVMGWRTATGPGIRIDHGLRVGQVIGSHYDPMLAKLIAWGESREDARRRLIRAIEDTVLIGVQDNRTFLANILKNPAFANGAATTAFIGSEFADDPSLSVQPLPREAWAIGALLRTLSLKVDTSLRGWHSAAMRPQPLTLVSGEQRCCLTVEYRPAGVDVMIDDKHVCLRVVDQHADYLVLEIDGVRTPVPYHNDGLRCWFSWHGQGFALADHTHTPHQAEDGPGSGQVRAPMDGLVLDVRCEVGQTVNKGQVLAVMEAMKMEHSLKAGVDGTIESVSIQCGDQVKGKQVVLTIVS